MIILNRKSKSYVSSALIFILALASFLGLVGVPTNTSADTVPNPISTTNTCGMNISLVLDNSGSITTGDMTTMKTAVEGFVDAFASDSPNFSVVSFNSTASIVQSFTTDTTLVKSKIDSIAVSNLRTNWQDGLTKAYATFDTSSTKGNLIIFASDGVPNEYYNGTTLEETTETTASQALAAAVTEANTIKAANVKILGLAIGSGANISNFEQITGPNVSPTPVPIGNTTDIISTDYGNLATNFASLYSSMCSSSIVVQNKIDTNGDGTAEITGSTSNPLLAGYGFIETGPTSNPSNTTDQTGTFQYTSLADGDYTITETPESGYHLESVSCIKENASTGTFDSADNSVTGLTIAQGDNIYCTFLNAAIPQTPLISLKVSVTPTQLSASGGDITFNYAVTNPSSVDLSQINLSDTQCSPISYVSGDTNSDQILQNTETWQYSCSRYTNTALTSNATVSAEYNDQAVTASDGALVSITPVGPPTTGHAD